MTLFLLYNCNTIHAQTFSSLWNLTSNGNATTTGSITANALTIGSGINTPTYSSGDGVTTNGWANDASNLNANEYYQYQITPTAGNKVIVTGVTLNHSVSAGNWIGAVYYSMDGFATTGSQLGSNFTSSSTGQTALNLTGMFSLTIPQGGSFTIRVYAWESDGNNRRFRNRNVTISGTSCALPSITTQPSSIAVCENGPVTFSVLATNATTYQWKKNNIDIVGETSNTLTIANASVLNAGTYTVNVGNSCDAIVSSSAVLTVNSKPTSITITPTSTTVCENAITTLVANGGIVSGVTILNENFNGATNNWTLENTSTGGTVADAAWKLRPNSYAYDVDVFNSNDNSQFYLSNSDDQGSGSTTSTRLISPVIDLTGCTSASLSFYHYYRVASGDTAKVQISTNGGATWSSTDLASYNTNQGADNGFALVSISLNSFVGNNNIKIRFNYSATWDWYWAIDNVSITASKPQVTWAPTTGLYLDNLATLPYTGQITNSVYVKLSSNETYTATSTNSSTGCFTSSNTASFTVLPNTTYYRDFDGDGFGDAAVTQLSCTGLPTGYVTNNSDCNDTLTFYTDLDNDGFGVLPKIACGTVTNNTDCDDTLTFYTDLDNDGFGALPKLACGTITNNTDCDDTLTFYTDLDNDGFGVLPKLACGTTTNNTDCDDAQIHYFDGDNDGFGTAVQVACGTRNTGDCNDANAAIHPGAVDVCYDGIDNDCNGIIDNACTPIVSVLQPSQCGVTLPAINSYIYANLVSGAQGYRFKVTDMTTNQVQTIDKALRVFTLTQLPNYAFDRMYQVEVSIRYANVWQPFFGLPCTIITPATTTLVQSAQCGATLTTMNDVIFANNVPFAAGYRFLITNLLTSEQHVFDRPIRDIRLTNLPSPQFNTTYSIEVAVKNTNGSYLPYGTACNVTSPSFPTTQVQNSQCDLATTLPLTTTLFADSFSGTTTYRFRFVNGATTIQVDRPLRSIYLGSVPGIQSGTAYSVSVALEINGTFGPFGKVCLVTTAGGARETEVVKPLSPFNALAYPNPFAEHFKLNVTTSVEASIQVKVYDMLGKLVENRTVDTAVINEVEIGENYPAGVYNVIVSQGSEVKNLRVIKR